MSNRVEWDIGHSTYWASCGVSCGGRSENSRAQFGGGGPLLQFPLQRTKSGRESFRGC